MAAEAAGAHSVDAANLPADSTSAAVTDQAVADEKLPAMGRSSTIL